VVWGVVWGEMDILLKCSLLVPCTILVPFSYHSVLFQKMEMSSPGEETYFAKKIVSLSFLFEKGFRFQTGFDPSWISLFHLGILSGTSLRTRRLVPIFYGNLRPAGAQTVWLLRFMLQLTTLSCST